jgi:Domain of unknown function (DUF4129)
MKRILPVVALFLQFALAANGQKAAIPAQAVPLDLNGYVSELNRWSASANRLRQHPAEAAALSKELPEHWSVAVQGQRFAVPTQWLRDALARVAEKPKTADGAVKEIELRIEAMRQDAEDLAQTPAVAPGVARSKLEGILKRREFRRVHGPSPVQTLWEQALGWLVDHLDWFFRRLGHHPTVKSVLLWSVVVVLGVIFLTWLVKALLSRSPRAPVDLAGPAAAAGAWRDWMEKARRAAAMGEYRDATRFAYTAAVCRLGELGVWMVDPSRTHREYLRLLPPDAAQRAPVAAITAHFEQVWYGRKQATADDFQSVVTELEMLH